MRQSFDEHADPAFGARHLPRIRAEMARQGLDGFLVPHEDEHQNEYLPAANERLAWTTGFTGSAGAAVVLADKAAVFTPRCSKSATSWRAACRRTWRPRRAPGR